MVTYEQLKNGYVLQEKDELVLHGLDYKVEFNQPDGNYLYCHHRANSYVFDILGMGARERKDFTRRFNPIRFGEAQGAFPEFNDLKTLTDLVIALYEVPEYKEGDWVTILPKESDDYRPIIYAYEMEGYAGNTYQVKSCMSRRETPTYNGVSSGDPHSYILCGVSYYWTSQMIRKATEEEIRKAKRGIKDSDSTTPSELMTPEEVVKKINAQTEEMEEMLKYIPTIPNDFNLSVYTPWWKDTPSDTEIRLPNNEEETPHIKL